MYYVYTLAYPDGTVFYVGKGKLGTRPERMLMHEMEARRGLNNYKCCVIRKIWANGGEVLKRRVAIFETSQGALDYECVLIAHYGRENLVNHTDGGGGTGGFSMPAQARERIRRALTGRKHSETHNKRKSAANKGKKPASQTIAAGQTPEVRARRGAKHAKTYPGFVAPDGTEYRNVTNLLAFCSDHGLESSCMRGLLATPPKARTHRGWRVIDTEAVPNKLTAKTYPGFVSPDGVIYRDVVNLSAFCREHGLNVTGLCEVASGIIRHHRGWRRLE